MALDLGTGYVNIRGDYSSVLRGAAVAGTTGGRSFSKAFMAQSRGLGKGLMKGVGLAAVAGGVALGAFATQGVKSLMRIEKINAQTDAAIRSTGGGAKVTRAEIEALAGSIEGMTGVEAESIQEGQNLLLTFRNIRNETGKGNDIFNQATTSLVDLSTAMGQEPKAAAIQLGKALNDPTKGIAALTRVGITFTEQQEDQIRTMQASGDILGAQKVILAELEAQFGGSAEAFGKTTEGRIERLKHQFGTFQESVVSGLIPVIGSVADWLEVKLPLAADWTLNAFDDLKAAVSPVTGEFSRVLDIGQPVVDFLRDNATTALWALGGAAAAILAPGMIGGLLGILGGLASVLLSPIVLIGALAAGFVVAYREVEPFREVVNNVASAIWDGLVSAFEWITGTGVPAVLGAWDDLRAGFTGEGDGLFGTIGEQAREVFDWITGTAIPAVTDAFTTVKDAVANFSFGDAWERVADFFTGIDWTGIRDTLADLIGERLGALKELGTALQGAFGPLKDLFTALWPVIKVVGIAFVGLQFVMFKVSTFLIGVLAKAITWIATNVLPPLTWYISNVLIPGWSWFGQTVIQVAGWIAERATWLWNTVLKPVFGFIWSYVTVVLIPMWQRIFDVVSTVFTGVWNAIQWAWALVQPVFAEVVAFIRDQLVFRFNALKDAAEIVWAAISAAIAWAWGEIKPKFDAIVGFVNDTLIPIWDKISGAVGAAFDKIPGIIRGALKLAGDVVAGFLRGAADVANMIGLDRLVGDPLERAAEAADKWGEARVAPRVAVFAEGGFVSGGIPGKDSVPAMLMPGEVVMQTSAVRKWGLGNLLALNEGRIPGYAVGGQVLLNGARMLQSQGARITEHPMFGGVGRGHARGGYHYSNLSGTGADAFDANFGPGGESSVEKAFFDAMAPHLRAMGLRVLWRVAGHFNHLHADIGTPGLGGGAGGGGGWNPLDALKKLDGLRRPDKGKGLLGIIGGGANALLDGVVSFVKDKASGLLSWGTGVGNGPVKGMVQAMALARGWTGSQWAALDELIRRESSWNPNAQNPTSTAYGLFQFLNSTWGTVGATKTSDPRQQAVAGFNYIAQRYGSPAAALAFHDRNNWYGQGGYVHKNPADGVTTLKPGWNAVNNLTGGDETVVNKDLLNKGPLIGEVNLYERTDVDALMQQVAWRSMAGQL